MATCLRAVSSWCIFLTPPARIFLQIRILASMHSITATMVQHIYAVRTRNFTRVCSWKMRLLIIITSRLYMYIYICYRVACVEKVCAALAQWRGIIKWKPKARWKFCNQKRQITLSSGVVHRRRCVMRCPCSVWSVRRKNPKKTLQPNHLKGAPSPSE